MKIDNHLKLGSLRKYLRENMSETEYIENLCLLFIFDSLIARRKKIVMPKKSLSIQYYKRL